MTLATRPAVLITDDDAGIRKLLQTVTEMHGCQAETAANGIEAIEKMRSGSYDLLLLDLMMPMMSGYDVIEQMKAMEVRPAVIVVTAMHEEAREADRIDGRVVSSILRKPFDIGIASELIHVAAEAVHNERAA
jgi:DNA-binding response OmpR family regulator